MSSGLVMNAPWRVLIIFSIGEAAMAVLVNSGSEKADCLNPIVAISSEIKPIKKLIMIIDFVFTIDNIYPKVVGLRKSFGYISTAARHR